MQAADAHGQGVTQSAHQQGAHQQGEHHTPDGCRRNKRCRDAVDEADGALLRDVVVRLHRRSACVRVCLCVSDIPCSTPTADTPALYRNRCLNPKWTVMPKPQRDGT